MRASIYSVGHNGDAGRWRESLKPRPGIPSSFMFHCLDCRAPGAARGFREAPSVGLRVGKVELECLDNAREWRRKRKIRESICGGGPEEAGLIAGLAPSRLGLGIRFSFSLHAVFRLSPPPSFLHRQTPLAHDGRVHHPYAPSPVLASCGPGRSLVTRSAGEVGALNTLEYRCYTEQNGKVVSPFHDIPLFANEARTVLNVSSASRPSSPSVAFHLELASSPS